MHRNFCRIRIQEGILRRELKRMSTFLSNFTELGFMDFDAEVLTNEDDPADMIRFGIWHNYINNYKSRIARCKKKNCEWGSLVIEGKYVTESIKKYFGVDYKKLASVTESDLPFYYDGTYYHFEGADGEAVYYAGWTRRPGIPKAVSSCGVRSTIRRTRTTSSENSRPWRSPTHSEERTPGRFCAWRRSFKSPRPAVPQRNGFPRCFHSFPVCRADG